MRLLILTALSFLASVVRCQAFISVFAGNGTRGWRDGPRTMSLFDSPSNIAVDSNGTIYVVETNANRIRKITRSGEVTTLAGGFPGFQDGQGSQASFNGPEGITIDTAGQLYVIDNGNQRIRKITPSGFVSTINSTNITGTGIVIAPTGDFFVSTDRYISKIAQGGCVSPFVGSLDRPQSGARDGQGTDASFELLKSMTLDLNGNLWVTDSNNIRKINPMGVVSTFAGNSSIGSLDGRGKLAKFNNPEGIAFDKNGVLYIADRGNYKIRRLYPNGIVNTLAGNGTQGLRDNAGTLATLYDPKALALDPLGNLYFVEPLGERVRIGLICPFGTFRSDNVCVRCPGGTFLTPGDFTCIQCPANTFSGSAARSCAACPTGRTSLPGSPNCTAIICPSGQAISRNTCTNILKPSSTLTLTSRSETLTTALTTRINLTPTTTVIPTPSSLVISSKIGIVSRMTMMTTMTSTPVELPPTSIGIMPTAASTLLASILSSVSSSSMSFGNMTTFTTSTLTTRITPPVLLSTMSLATTSSETATTSNLKPIIFVSVGLDISGAIQSVSTSTTHATATLTLSSTPSAAILIPTPIDDSLTLYFGSTSHAISSSIFPYGSTTLSLPVTFIGPSSRSNNELSSNGILKASETSSQPGSTIDFERSQQTPVESLPSRTSTSESTPTFVTLDTSVPVTATESTLMSSVAIVNPSVNISVPAESESLNLMTTMDQYAHITDDSSTNSKATVLEFASGTTSVTSSVSVTGMSSIEILSSDVPSDTASDSFAYGIMTVADATPTAMASSNVIETNVSSSNSTTDYIANVPSVTPYTTVSSKGRYTYDSSVSNANYMASSPNATSTGNVNFMTSIVANTSATTIAFTRSESYVSSSPIADDLRLQANASYVSVSNSITSFTDATSITIVSFNDYVSSASAAVAVSVESNGSAIRTADYIPSVTGSNRITDSSSSRPDTSVASDATFGDIVSKTDVTATATVSFSPPETYVSSTDSTSASGPNLTFFESVDYIASVTDNTDFVTVSIYRPGTHNSSFSTADQIPPQINVTPIATLTIPVFESDTSFVYTSNDISHITDGTDITRTYYISSVTPTDSSSSTFYLGIEPTSTGITAPATTNDDNVFSTTEDTTIGVAVSSSGYGANTGSMSTFDFISIVTRPIDIVTSSIGSNLTDALFISDMPLSPSAASIVPSSHLFGIEIRPSILLSNASSTVSFEKPETIFLSPPASSEPSSSPIFQYTTTTYEFGLSDSSTPNPMTGKIKLSLTLNAVAPFSSSLWPEISSSETANGAFTSSAISLTRSLTSTLPSAGQNIRSTDTWTSFSDSLAISSPQLLSVSVTPNESKSSGSLIPASLVTSSSVSGVTSLSTIMSSMTSYTLSVPPYTILPALSSSSKLLSNGFTTEIVLPTTQQSFVAPSPTGLIQPPSSKISKTISSTIPPIARITTLSSKAMIPSSTSTRVSKSVLSKILSSSRLVQRTSSNVIIQSTSVQEKPRPSNNPFVEVKSTLVATLKPLTSDIIPPGLLPRTVQPQISTSYVTPSSIMAAPTPVVAIAVLSKLESTKSILATPLPVFEDTAISTKTTFTLIPTPIPILGFLSPCSAGQYSSGRLCLPCPPGTFSDGSTNCTACAAGTFSGSGAVSCRVCPSGSTSNSGSSSCFSLNDSTSPCSNCVTATTTSTSSCISCQTTQTTVTAYRNGGYLAFTNVTIPVYSTTSGQNYSSGSNHLSVDFTQIFALLAPLILG